MSIQLVARCDDINCTKIYTHILNSHRDSSQPLESFRNYLERKGWRFSNDGDRCWCPECAPRKKIRGHTLSKRR